MFFNRGRGAELSTVGFGGSNRAKSAKDVRQKDQSKKGSPSKKGSASKKATALKKATASKKASVLKNGGQKNQQPKGSESDDNNGEDDSADNTSEDDDENSDSDSIGDGNNNNSGAPSTKEEYHSLVSAELVRQLMELAPLAMGKRVSKSFPYKLWGAFAYDNRLRMRGWPIQLVATYPGDRNFKLTELVVREWRALYDSVIVSGRLRIERWHASTYFFNSHFIYI